MNNPPDPVERAERITEYAVSVCADCKHRSAEHSDIGTCQLCTCLCFEEAS